MAKDTARLRILVPDATTNYIQNPSVRFDTTGWNAFSATISRTLDYARFGISSLKVVTTGALLNEGTYYRVSNLTGISEPITVSVYVCGSGKVRIRLIDNPSGSQWASQPIWLNGIRWTRIEVTGRSTGRDDMRLYVESAETTAKALTFYVDGAQMERKPYATTYCDGDQAGCRWNNIQAASLSTRPANTRSGGRWITLSGKDRQYEDLYMTVVGGLGMASIENNSQPFALAPGGYHQNSKINERVITLTFHAKHKDLLGRRKIITLTHLHELRQFLIDTIKPDLVSGDQEFMLEYQDSDLPVYFYARYDGGLDGKWDIRNQWVNSFPLRLLAENPLLYEDQQVVKQLDFQNSFLMNFVFGRIDGQWSQLNYGVNGQIGCGATGPKGHIYIAGVFTVINNNAAATSPLKPGVVAYWDGAQWTAIATSMTASATINAIAVAPNGDVYVGGDFTTIHGVAANRIAKYTLATGTWSALGTGANGTVRAVAVAPNGNLYVGGDFSTLGGVSTVRIGYWDGLQWRRVGQYGGLDGSVKAIAITNDGSLLYAGGEFENENGLATSLLKCVAQYNIATGLFSAMGDGFSDGEGTDEVRSLLISNSGIVYAGGDFTLSGTTTVNNVAKFVGRTWIPLGSGVDRVVYILAEFQNGNIIAGGRFNNTSNTPVSKVALWNGSTWVPLDEIISVTSTDSIFACVIDKATDDLYLGFGSNIGTQKMVLFSGLNAVTNTGTTECSPNMYILGPGILKWIENQTTKKRLYFNLNILQNEEVFIDFSKSVIRSTVRGDLSYAVLPGSDFRAFKLAPGSNQLACFIHSDVNAVMQIGFTPQHWSADITEDVESL